MDRATAGRSLITSLLCPALRPERIAAQTVARAHGRREPRGGEGARDPGAPYGKANRSEGWRALGLLGKALAICLALLAIFPASPPHPARATGPLVVADNTWITDGAVAAIARDPSTGTVYIGGNFTYIGSPTGSGVPLDTNTGRPEAGHPRVNGSVNAVAPDGTGGWYIAGAFTQVGALVRGRLAHILGDKSVDPAWNPIADGDVLALAVSGSTVYAGGGFSTIGGQPRSRIAALDAATGGVTPWNPAANSTVYALAVSGETVYVGGTFTSIGGQPRNRIAGLEAAAGGVTSWDPNANGWVLTVTVSGDTVYAGGNFTSIGGQARNKIAALDAATGGSTAWNPNASQGLGSWGVQALAVSAGTVYAGGSFAVIGGKERWFIAALDEATGTATSWNPRADRAVQALAVSGGTVYAGGLFRSIGGQARFRMAALDAATGRATDWVSDANNDVEALAVAGGKVFSGGDFSSIGGRARSGLAALDEATGTVTSWNPEGSAGVFSLVVSGGTVYLGGNFNRIGGQARSGLAALDTVTGSATAWNPSPNMPAVALAVSGGTVYAGGAFTSIGGQARNHIAALDAATGSATTWNPNAEGALPNSVWESVNSLAVSGSTVYAGGNFARIGRQARPGLAALDAATGNATDWNPNAGRMWEARAVAALVISGGTVFAGEGVDPFTGRGGAILAVDEATGAAITWRAEASDPVAALTVAGGTVYAGGNFTSIGGQARNGLAALDAATGKVTDWDPNASGFVTALAIRGATVYVGGESGLAAVSRPLDLRWRTYLPAVARSYAGAW